MSTAARKRSMREFKQLQQDPPSGISGAPYDSNIMLWTAVIFGPDDTPWDGGTFKTTLQFSEDYLTSHQECTCSIQTSLLSDPKPNSPANSEAARLFSENKRDNRKVRETVEQSWIAD